KFPCCSRCLRAGSLLDGAWLRCGHNVSHSENVAITSGKGDVLLPVQFEIVRKNSQGWPGVCSICLCMDWLERALRLGALPRVPREHRIRQGSLARRTGPGAAQSSPLAQPCGSGKHSSGKKALRGGFDD